MRQYIGARYVPRFVGPYDNTQAYEALDVVDNGMGTSYIAKKPVPVNTPLTNTDYWFVYGASSGAILDLQTRMDAAEVDISLLKNHKYIFVSDSYGARTYNTKTLIENIADRIGITSDDYENVQRNGSGFIGLGGGIPTFLEELQAHAFTIDPDEITDIIVMGGANDLLESENSLLTAISAFCAYCHTTFPNAKIRVGHTGRYWNKTYLNDIRTNSLPAWRKCNLYGASYIKNSEYILHDRILVEADNVHPTSEGVNQIARQIANAILSNGDCDVHYRSTINFAGTTNAYFNYVNLSNVAPIHVSVDNEVTTMTFGEGTIISGQSSTPSAQSANYTINDILTLNHGTDQLVLLGNYTDNVTKGIAVPFGIRDGSLVTQGNVPGSIYFGSTDNCIIKIKLNLLNGSWSTLPIGGIDAHIPACSMTMPSDEC